jgi:hypothetical protein
MSSNIASKSSDRTFYLFPALPPELRLRIWHFALQTPQMVALCTNLKSVPLKKYKTRYLFAKPIGRPLLLVNVEARRAALSAYLPGFYDKSGNTVVWINPKLDTLYLDGISVDLLVKYGITTHIERVAFAVEDWERDQGIGKSSDLCWRIRLLCDQMKALKEVQIVAWDELKWLPAANSWIKESYLKSGGEEGWEEAWRQIATRFIRARGKTIEQFRQVMEQTIGYMGFSPLRASVSVRAIALGVSGVDSSWDHELELL